MLYLYQLPHIRRPLLFVVLPIILSSIAVLLIKPSHLSIPASATVYLKPTRLFRNFTVTTRAPDAPTAMSDSGLKITLRPNQDRGHGNYGWLRTFHTFDVSPAAAPGKPHYSHGALRVINEDRVDPYTGFGMHSHREFEIFSYIIAGQLEHKDSMGNVEILKRGDIQLTSAGTGISHSEKAYGSKEVHFIQIWSLPFASNLTPRYYTRHFSDEDKKQGWVRVVAPATAEGIIMEREASGPAPVQSHLTLDATLISPGTVRPHKFPGSGSGKKAFVQVVQTSGYNPQAPSGAIVKIGDGQGTEQVLKEGDSAYLIGEGGGDVIVENVGEKVAEVLLFDV